ncbi:MAG: hypothetical protein HRU13_11015 [Phycisphaerales bacterium]|nr:hypothetical protein [Phycisphaerales bacterium]
MRFQTLLTLVSAGTALSSAALADDLFVPSPEHPTLQAALDAAMDGDTIVIRAGTLTGPGNWDLSMPPIQLTFRGETGDPADVLWRGTFDASDDPIRAMRLSSPLASGTRFEDLTVRNFTSPGGGAFNVGAIEVTFDNCVIEGNHGGASDCFESERGGAFEAIGSTLHFHDCAIRWNGASGVGCSGSSGSGTGGVIYGPGSTLVFEGCVIERNAAGGGEGASGTGGVVDGATSVTFIDCVVRDNFAYGQPANGGVASSVGSVTVIDSDFTDNRARSYGTGSSGGAFIASSATIVNSTFVGNIAGDSESSGAGGGAISVSGSAEIVNSVFAENRAWGWGDAGSVEGGAIVIGSGTLIGVTMTDNERWTLDDQTPQAIHVRSGELRLVNTVIDNGPEWLTLGGGASATATWSCIVGGFPGEGNIDADPMLDALYQPMRGSPVIDAGNTTLLPADEFDLDGDGDTSEAIPFDAAGRTRVVDNPFAPDTGVGMPVVDMGAYERPLPCPVDLDGDGELTLFDFLAFQSLFDLGSPAADFDGDGSLTLFDFLAFQNAFDAGCP